MISMLNNKELKYVHKIWVGIVGKES